MFTLSNQAHHNYNQGDSSVCGDGKDAAAADDDDDLQTGHSRHNNLKLTYPSGVATPEESQARVQRVLWPLMSSLHLADDCVSLLLLLFLVFLSSSARIDLIYGRNNV